LRFIIATSGSEVGHGFDVDSVRKVPNYRLPFVGFKGISAGPDATNHQPPFDDEGVDFCYRSTNNLNGPAVTFLVIASESGSIVEANHNGSFGNHIQIRHSDGSRTLYAHLRSFAPGIRQNVVVTKGQQIGWAGKSGLGPNAGIHLHFQIFLPKNPPFSDRDPEDRAVRFIDGIHWATGDPNNTDNTTNCCPVPPCYLAHHDGWAFGPPLP
jgi:hypothetical protein